MSRKLSLPQRSSRAGFLFGFLAPLLAWAELTPGPERSVSKPETETLTRANDVSVASFGSVMLVAWADRRSELQTDIVVARVTHGGRVLDPNGIILTSTPGSETAPLVAHDNSRFVVVWGDGTNTWGAEVTEQGVISTAPVILGPGTPTSVSLNTRTLLVTIEDGSATTIYHLRTDLTLRRVASIGGAEDVQLARLGTGWVAVWVEPPFNPIGNFVIRALRLDRNTSIVGSSTIDEVDSFEHRPTVAVDTFDGDAVFAVGSLDRMAVARMEPSGVVTLLDASNTLASRSIEDVVGHATGFDVLTILDGQARIFRYVNGARTDVVPVAGIPTSGDGTLSNEHVYTVWTVGGVLTGRTSFANSDETTLLIGRSVISQQLPAVVAGANATLVAWMEDAADTRDRIMAKLVAPDGTHDESIKPLVVGSRSATSVASVPAVAWTGNGYLVAWLDHRFVTLPTAVLTVRTITANGALAAAIDVTSNALASLPPAMAGGAGDALVVWSESANAPQLHGAFMSQPLVRFAIPGLAANASVVRGDFAYLVAAETSSGTVRSVLVSHGGTVQGLPFDTMPPLGSTDASPAVAWSGSNYLLVFRRDTAIYGRMLGRDGAAVRSDFRISNDAHADNPHVAWDGAAFVVAWTTRANAGAEGDIVAARVLANFTVEPSSVISASARNDDHPAVTGIGEGRSLIAYQRMTAELQDVHRVYTRVVTGPAMPPVMKRRAVR